MCIYEEYVRNYAIRCELSYLVLFLTFDYSKSIARASVVESTLGFLNVGLG